MKISTRSFMKIVKTLLSLSLIPIVSLAMEADVSDTKVLMEAANTGNEVVLNGFLYGFGNPNLADKDGTSLLMKASSGDQGKIVQTLLVCNADINYQRPSDKMTALMCAVLSGGTKALTVLLKNSANVELLDSQGLTALMHAAKDSAGKPVNENAISLLLKHGASTPLKNAIRGETQRGSANQTSGSKLKIN